MKKKSKLTTKRARKSKQTSPKVLAEIPTMEPRSGLPIVGLGASAGGLEALEVYVTSHSEATFSHGLCPKCVEKVRRQMDG